MVSRLDLHTITRPNLGLNTVTDLFWGTACYSYTKRTVTYYRNTPLNAFTYVHAKAPKLANAHLYNCHSSPLSGLLSTGNTKLVN